MANVLLYYLIVINIVTFLVYGIDKAASKRGQSQTRLSYAEREQARPKVKLKAKQGNWRISEATLLMLAVIGGSIGALLGHLHNHVGLTENFDQSENEEFLVNDSP
jgi:uncharacterized membrane protein YsdA (DUF1294 family)